MTILPIRAQIMRQEARMGTIEYGRIYDRKRGNVVKMVDVAPIRKVVIISIRAKCVEHRQKDHLPHILSLLKISKNCPKNLASQS